MDSHMKNFSQIVPRESVMLIGTVLRHRLSSDAAGRFLDFSLVNGDAAIRCRFRPSGLLGSNLTHGSRYGVIGRWDHGAGQLVLAISFVLSMGGPRTSICAGRANRRKHHRAIARKLGR